MTGTDTGHVFDLSFDRDYAQVLVALIDHTVDVIRKSAFLYGTEHILRCSDWKLTIAFRASDLRTSAYGL